MPQYDKVFDCIKAIFTYYAERTDILKTLSIDYLLKKNAMDIDCIATLAKLQNSNNVDYAQQIMVIVRSFIESSILFIFLLKNKEHRIQYQQDSQLLLFKNAFIEYKYALTSKFDTLMAQSGFTKELLQQGMIDTYNNLSDSNKTRILTEIQQTEFVFVQTTVSKLDDFLKKFKPISFRVRTMWKYLNDEIEINDKTIEDLTKLDYNTASQFTHNIYPLHRPCIYDAARICFSLANITCAIIKDEYKQEVSDDVRQQILNAYIILHPEDLNQIQ